MGVFIFIRISGSVLKKKEKRKKQNKTKTKTHSDSVWISQNILFIDCCLSCGIKGIFTGIHI